MTENFDRRLRGCDVSLRDDERVSLVNSPILAKEVLHVDCERQCDRVVDCPSHYSSSRRPFRSEVLSDEIDLDGRVEDGADNGHPNLDHCPGSDALESETAV